ncbi:16431_t:CDS:2, partial [Cetraspora pellucida]
LNIQIESNYFGAHTMDALFDDRIFFAKPDKEGSWSIFGYNMTRYVNDTTGFRNLLINSSIPSNNATLNIRNTSNLTITYKTLIMQSSFNLLIYKINPDNTKILRQKYSSSYCSITFNDNGFVKDLKYQEQLPGIADNLWMVKTVPQGNNSDNKYAVTGYLRLSKSVTNYFIYNLNTSEQQQYIQNLSNELIKTIPTKSSRLHFSGRFEVDSSGQILCELSVYAQQDNSVTQIIDDINTLINNKFITNIDNSPLDIDETYKFTQRSNLFEEIKYLLIELAASIPIYFITLYLHKRTRNQKKCLYFRKFSPTKRCPHELNCLSEFKCYNMQKDEFNNVFSQNNWNSLFYDNFKHSSLGRKHFICNIQCTKYSNAKSFCSE